MRIPNLIIGGGLAGTTIAVSLRARGEEFLLLESSHRLGGKVETLLTPEACFEFGPNSFTDQSNQGGEIFQLLETLGLTPDLLEAGPVGHNRYILKRGKVVRLPSGIQEIFTTQALSLRGRLRFLRELFYVPKRRSEEESVRDFFVRHFGREVADTFADPFVSGIYAGDAAQLSLQSALPMMAEAEAQSSSLIRYLLTHRKGSKATPRSYQLRQGLESIFHRALENIGRERIHLGETVHEVAPEGKGVRVVTGRGDYDAERLYLTTPAYTAATLLENRFGDLSQLLRQVDYAPVVTVHAKIPAAGDFPYKGFGILLPSIERRRILGALWNSFLFPSLFPDKANHYLTVYVGGTRHRELVDATESDLRQIVCDELQDLLGLDSSPTILHVRRHTRAIPQYLLGYGKILRGIAGALPRTPFLQLAGNYLGGVSMPKTVQQAAYVANRS